LKINIFYNGLNMEAIILAGGVGSRLRSVIKDIPKPMALVNSKPFLEIILDNLNKSGFKKVILSVGYLSEIIIGYFGNNYKDIKIEYAIEEVRLGTGGAIKYAMGFCSDEYVFIFNGDTFLNVDFEKIIKLGEENNRPVIVSRNVDDVSRYGSLIHFKKTLVDYREKKGIGAGEINAGCYYLPRTIMGNCMPEEAFSFEGKSIPSIMKNPGFMVFKHDGIFIDIGIPDDLKKAKSILAEYAKY